jgi:hypothetical protein
MKGIGIAILLSSLLLSACSASGPAFTPAAAPERSSALVYIYRPGRIMIAPVSPGILIDGEERILMKNNGYSFFYLPPGKHSFALLLSDRYKGLAHVNTDLQSGHTYFLKVDGDHSSFGMFKSISFRLLPVSEQTARDEIGECKYLDPAKSDKFSKSYLFEN